MRKKIFLNNKYFYYKIKNSNRIKKNIRLKIDHKKRILITAPKGLPIAAVEGFLLSKKDWIFRKILFFSKNNNCIFLKNTNKEEYLKQKRIARSIVQSRVTYYSKKYGFRFNKINIRNQKTRWGSCSEKGNLSFNFRIVYLTKKQRDYIIVHELCHLKEFNHSWKFWSLVEEIIPDYASIKNEIKRIVF